MINLLYITNGINGSGGLERVLSIKASLLATNFDYQVHILVLNNTHKEPFYKFSDKIKFHSIKVSGNPIIYFLKYKKGIQKTIKAIKPDIISVCDDGLKGILFPVIFGKKTPVIYERHVSRQVEIKKDSISILKNIKTELIFKLMNFSAKKFNKFVVLTNGNVKEWKINNLIVIPNPLPFDEIEKSSLINKKVLAVGRQSYQKGYDILLKIWKTVSHQFPDWTLEIYGNIDKNLGLTKLSEEYNITQSVYFFPPVKNIQNKYKEASIYVMSSRFEGFGMVLIEAMIHGVPCISYKCPHGPSDIINNGVDGILVNNGDVLAFANSIIELIKNREMRIQMGTSASQNVKRYLPNNIITQWDDLFKTILNNKY